MKRECNRPHTKTHGDVVIFGRDLANKLSLCAICMIRAVRGSVRVKTASYAHDIEDEVPMTCKQQTPAVNS